MWMSSVDEFGRRIGGRRGGSEESDDTFTGSNNNNADSSNDNNDYYRNTKKTTTSGGGGGGWDDFDPLASTQLSSSSSFSQKSAEKRKSGWSDSGWSEAAAGQRSSTGSRPRQPSSSSSSSSRDNHRSSSNNNNRRDSFSRSSSNSNNNNKRDNYNSDNNNNNNNYSKNKNRNFREQGQERQERKINLNALDMAGFVHLYGLAPVYNSLKANRRDFSRPEDDINLEELEGEALAHELAQRQRKPEAQFTPWLFVQDSAGSRTTTGRSGDKSLQGERILKLAEERGLPVATVDKGVLNTLSNNRPHQGFVLRCGALDFEPLNKIPLPEDNNSKKEPCLWLVLDEVVDPQNLGALLRSAHFLGNVKVLVCAKNSAPASPTVSAASAGALELLTVYATNSLPKTLAQAEQDGFRIIGASSSVPKDAGDLTLYNLQDLPSLSGPTLLVLGSEGHGLRQLVSKCCTEFVRIPGGSDNDGVDSLNVSVTGGILLWQLLQSMRSS
jgi:21S rRNA (GM2251-2'-O)-methyltransferase